ncbi:hypothetical protein HN51_063330 [Arachis hypogaea]
MNGYGKQALQLFSQTVVHGVASNDVTFIGLLSACSHEGMMSIGVMLFKAMAVEICECWWVVNVVVCWRRESVSRRERRTRIDVNLFHARDLTYVMLYFLQKEKD